MDINFSLSAEAASFLKELAEKRGVPLPALACRFVEQGIGRTCQPCAGMGTDEEANLCHSCCGTGINQKAGIQLARRSAEILAREFVCGELFTMLPLFGPKEVDIDGIIRALVNKFSGESS